MGRKYTAMLSNQAWANADGTADLMKILAPTDAIVRIHSIHIGQNTEEGDAQAEMIRVQLKRGQGTFTENSGSAITPAKHEDSDGSATATVTGYNATPAVAGTGTLEVIREEAFNAQSGWWYTPTPEEQIILRPTIGTNLSALIVHLPGTADDDMSLSCTVVFEEVG